MFIPLMYLLASTLSPGAVTVLVIYTSTRHGRLAGIAIALGGTASTVIFVLIAWALATNNSISHVSFDTANRYQQVGALLILMMGLHAAYSSLFGMYEPANQSSPSSQIAKSFFSGMALMVPHFPPAILFYTIILPQYTNPADLQINILLMGLVKTLLTIGWYTTLSFMAKSIQKRLFHARAQRVVEFGVACFLVGTSIALLL